MQFQEFIDRDWIAEKTLDLVAIPSETLAESKICSYVAQELAKLGLDPFTREVSQDRFNVYAKLEGSKSDRSLILNAHLDTIPIGTAWPAKKDSSRIYGRGAEDMKGGIAAILAMLRAFNLSNTQLAGDLWITFVVGHEDAEAAKDGPLAMCEDINSGLLFGDAIAIAEGDSAIWSMSTGSSVFKVKLKSKLGGTHTNNINFNMNPIRYVGQIIKAIEDLQNLMDSGDRHHLVGAERVDIGKVIAGDYYNRTPEVSIIEGIIRWLPGRTENDVYKQLTSIVAPIAAAGELDFEIEMMMAREPFETPVDNPVIQSAMKSYRSLHGSDPALIGKRITGDANIFVERTKIPAFYFGPGYQTAHSNNEWVEIDSVVNVSKFFGSLTLDYLGESR